MSTDFAPTPEQAHAVKLFQAGGPGDVIAVEAGAGTGKTSTLVHMANGTRQRGQYVAFNKAIVTDAGRKLPQNVDASTAHGLAFRAVGRQYGHRLRSSQRMRSIEIARHLNTGPINVTFMGKTKVLQPGYLAGYVQRAVTRFCQSADLVPDLHHFPYIEGIDEPDPTTGKKTYANNREVRKACLGAVRRAWDDVNSVNGILPYRHDHYLKAWHLSGPKIAADFLLLDEAQDLNPVLRDIVMQQTQALRVFVGDSQQAIYGFTGAVNALAEVAADQRAFLTQSFRFGQAIADAANEILSEPVLNSQLRLKGLPSIPSRRGVAERPDVVLCRTNAKAVGRFLGELKAGNRPYLVGGGKEVYEFARAAIDLRDRGWTPHPELACFKSWAEVQEYVEQDEQGDELKLLVSLVDQFTPEAIVAGLDGRQEERNADVIISTAHKSKGREWGSVLLGPDFPDADRMEADDYRLLYVAVTRAKGLLDVSDVEYFDPAVPVVFR